MDLSINSIIASLVFSSIGIWFFRYGKRESEPKILIIGMLLMGYSYFIENHSLMWVVGIALTAWGWWEAKGKYQ